MSGSEFTLRVAGPNDADAVTAVLASAYPALMAPDYDPAVLAATLPSMAKANPMLLASDTYYVMEAPGGRIVSCGGWTREEPGTRKIEDGIAHVRHFGTHVDWIRKGLGRAIFERCRREALAASVYSFRCFSSLGAEPFYASLGFHVVERTEITIGGGLKFPSITMVWTDRPMNTGSDAIP
jgi:GNAT superfamily N-acetyltransferase